MVKQKMMLSCLKSTVFVFYVLNYLRNDSYMINLSLNLEIKKGKLIAGKFEIG